MALNDAQRQAIAAIDGPPKDTGTKQTQEGKAQEAGAPRSEAAQMADTPYIEIDMGNGQKRQMTPEQIKGMSSRYTALNHKHAQLKPVTDVIENFLRSNPNMNPAQLAEQLQQLAAANQRDVQFGRGGINDPDGNGQPGNSRVGQRSQQRGQRMDSDGDMDNSVPGEDEFSRWENDNASTLPPGYKNMYGNMQRMQQMMAQQTQMIQQLLGASAGHVDAARSVQQGAMQQQRQAIQATIGNNLDRAQQALGLPDDSAQDFMMFAQERGYNLEDFVDGQLTQMVMRDFANNRQSPEMDRLRQIHQRRTAFTPNGGQAPMGGGGGQSDPSAADFQGFADRMVSQRR